MTGTTLGKELESWGLRSRIGLTPSDAERYDREQEVKRLWTKREKPDLLRKTDTILGDSFYLVREAMSCYQNGAYLATAIMCRTALETSVYFSLTRRPVNLRIGRRDWKAVNSDFSLRSKRDWEFLLGEAKRVGFVDEHMASDIGHVREVGNFVAHYGQRVDRSVWVSLKGRTRVRSWVRRKEALEVLDLTVKVLFRLMKRMDYAIQNVRIETQ